MNLPPIPPFTNSTKRSPKKTYSPKNASTQSVTVTIVAGSVANGRVPIPIIRVSKNRFSKRINAKRDGRYANDSIKKRVPKKKGGNVFGRIVA